MIRSPFRQLSLFIGLIALAVAPPQVEAQDKAKSFEGSWNVTAETDEGRQTHVMEIKRSGDVLSGKIIQEDADRKLRDVKIADGKLTFEFDMEAQETDLVIEIEYTNKGDSLDGTWAAFVDGDEAATGSTTAQRIVETKFAGVWNTIAVLPSGDELEGVLKLKGTNDDLSGVISSENGDTKIDKITTKGKNISLEFVLDVQGQSRDVVIKTKLYSADALDGQWIILDDNGDEAASGEWLADRAAKKKAADSDSNAVFDGSSLDSFRGYAKEEIGAGWKIVDGELYFDGTKKSGDIITRQEYGNFELEFEWKISEGGNSGVMYRVSLGDKKPYLTGPEYQVLDDSKHKDGGKETTSSGALYALYAPANKKLNPVGEWNSSKIVLKGNNVEHWLNGTKVVAAEIGSDDWNQKVENSKFKTWEKFAKNKKGHICFQDHGNPVWFRNIKIKPLD